MIFSLYVILKDFIDLSELTFWPLEILYIGIISYFLFKIKISRHKKFAICIMVTVTIIDIVESFFPTTKHKDLKNKSEFTDKNIFDRAIIKYGAYSIPLFYLANELKQFQRDYCWVKSKYLMDINYVSPYKIFISIGTIGIFFVAIFFAIFTYVPCKTFNNVDKIENNYIHNNETLKLYKEYCSLKDYDENTKTLYLFYDSIKLISREYSNTDKENMLEIFVFIPLLFILYVLNEISRLMLVKYTDPNNIVIYRYFYYFFKRLIVYIINEGKEEYLTLNKFILFELEEVAEIISGLIYIEVLELKFCGLDYELKKNIDRRGNYEINTIFNIDEDSNKDDSNKDDSNSDRKNRNKLLEDADNEVYE